MPADGRDGVRAATSGIHGGRLFLAGLPDLPTVREAAVHRFRPIILTALAAILAMIPLTRSTFWGPMAVAIMGGLIVATLLTIFFLPALYELVFDRRGHGRTQAEAQS